MVDPNEAAGLCGGSVPWNGSKSAGMSWLLTKYCRSRSNPSSRHTCSYASMISTLGLSNATLKPEPLPKYCRASSAVLNVIVTILADLVSWLGKLMLTTRVPTGPELIKEPFSSCCRVQNVYVPPVTLGWAAVTRVMNTNRNTRQKRVV